MTKRTAYIILYTLVALLIAPMAVMGYAIVFGHHFSSEQLNAAGLMLLAGGSLAVFSIMILSMMKDSRDL